MVLPFLHLRIHLHPRCLLLPRIHRPTPICLCYKPLCSSSSSDYPTRTWSPHPARPLAPPRPRLCAVPFVTGTLGSGTHDIIYSNRCALPGSYLVSIVLAGAEHPPVNGRATYPLPKLALHSRIGCRPRYSFLDNGNNFSLYRVDTVQ